MKQEPPRVGAVWLYRELYRHKSGRGYEAHILFEAPAGPVYRKICAAALIDTRIICDEKGTHQGFLSRSIPARRRRSAQQNAFAPIKKDTLG